MANVVVSATPAKHHGGRRPFGPKARPLGFVTAAERSVYFAGDTDLFAGMEKLPRVDVALLPAGSLLRPRIATPIHWGTYYKGRSGTWVTEPSRAFAALMAKQDPDAEVHVLHPDESCEL